MEQMLIPGGGTTNWFVNAHERNYNEEGFIYDQPVTKIDVAHDASVLVYDYDMYDVSDKFDYKRVPFCTVIHFRKKEKHRDELGELEHFDRERDFKIYYPYGTRFDENLLASIFSALSLLIDKARITDKKEYYTLSQIEKDQKNLINLFITGTNDKDIASKLSEYSNLDRVIDLNREQIVREVSEKKDLLPVFHYNRADEFLEFVEMYHSILDEK